MRILLAIIRHMARVITGVITRVIMWGVRNILTPVLIAMLIIATTVVLGALLLYFTGWEIPTG